VVVTIAVTDSEAFLAKEATMPYHKGKKKKKKSK
jgi:hypothetical protein